MAVVVALAWLAAVVPSLSVAVPLVLPALPPALVVVAPVAVGSPGWWSKKQSGEERGGEMKERADDFIKRKPEMEYDERRGVEKPM